jgi:predicted ArsR family transcriptional regulator
MSLTVADLAQHIVTLRRLYARVLEADIELLRRAYGESIVEEALRLADQAARQASEAPQELPPASDERASAVVEALNRLMDGR